MSDDDRIVITDIESFSRAVDQHVDRLHRQGKSCTVGGCSCPERRMPEPPPGIRPYTWVKFLEAVWMVEAVRSIGEFAAMGAEESDE